MSAAKGRRPEALEDGWLLRELMTTHGLSQRDLALRTGRTVSWVSRRLALVAVLPDAVQDHLRRGAVGAHVAQKILVPLARANAADCTAFAATIAREHLSSRQLAQWWRAWQTGDATVRAHLLRAPLLYLRAVAVADRRVALPAETPEGRAAAALGAVAGACWKARGQLGRLVETHPEISAHAAVQAGARQAQQAWTSLRATLEAIDAGRGHPHGDPEAGR